ncbi:MAG: hypothetical protein JJT88_19695 [Gammaproteobacteria bacterium]|nr:hypothetical protein [Gammaproteobacteria bacterium]
MNNTHLLIVLAVAGVLALPASATTPPRSSLSESRGYQNCLAAAEGAMDMRHVASTYYIYEDDDSRRYYMNGFALIDGASTEVKIDCLTTFGGRRIESLSVAPGVFVGRQVEHPSLVSTD